MTLKPLAVRPEDAAKIIGLSRSEVYNMIRDGVFVPFSHGRARLIPYSQLEAWVQKKSQEAA